MTRIIAYVFACALLLGSALFAQDIAGDWQGTIKAGSQELRVVIKIAKGDDGGKPEPVSKPMWTAAMYSIDQNTNAIPVNGVTLEGDELKLTVDAVRGSYQGKLSADGNSVDGTWTQLRALPLELRRATKETAWDMDPTAHGVQFVNVEKDVRLEVLDWGGTGRPLVLLTGLGDNAHVFDKFAQKLIATYHVYGITRRGFGASSVPASGYSADRLGDDVLAVLDALKLTRPVVAGHSIGGEELSSIGIRHPEKVAGLIYLDAAYAYAFYNQARGSLVIDLVELQKKLDQLQPGKGPSDPRPLVKELLESGLPLIEKDLRQTQKDMDAMPPALLTAQATLPLPVPAQAIIAGEQKYTANIKAPILAIFAEPHDWGPLGGADATARAALEASDEETTEAQAKAFEIGEPSARVVRLNHANHYVFRSNEADVLREMNAFIGNLPQNLQK